MAVTATTRRFAIPAAVLVAAGIAVQTAGVANADPQFAEHITVVCANGQTYAAEAFSSGPWSPALDSSGNTVLIPVSFGPTTFTVTDSNGNVIDSETNPPMVKGSAQPPVGTATTCSYSFSDIFDDPNLGPLTVSGSGTVTGFTTPVGG